jgi:hypothetical protein
LLFISFRFAGGDKNDQKVKDRDGGRSDPDPSGDSNHVFCSPSAHNPHLRR